MNLNQFAETHEVTNQPPPLDGANLYRIDVPLGNGAADSGRAGRSRVSTPTVRWQVAL